MATSDGAVLTLIAQHARGEPVTFFDVLTTIERDLFDGQLVVDFRRGKPRQIEFKTVHVPIENGAERLTDR